MDSLTSSTIPFLLSLILLFPWLKSAHTHEDFLQCLTHHSENSSISQVVYTTNNSSYSSVLQSTLQNLRFNSTDTPKPLIIITPNEISQIQAAIICSSKHGLQIRVRSGGHDFEGLSYVSNTLPFVIIDLTNLRAISVDAANRNAWVQAGATLGEVYYKIADKSRTLAFPAGGCPTVGVGGHFSGGGYGTLMRKYGLAADNIIDAQVIDVHGRILHRASMGEDLFWAIRGGGGNTFGVVVAWKIKLVQVPPTVTVFVIGRSLEQNATNVVHRWQYVASKLPEELFVLTVLRKANSSQGGTILGAGWTGLYLGRIDKLLQLMEESFPELGLKKEHCIEGSWIESAMYLAGFPRNATMDVLLDRSYQKSNFKAKSDYVKEPIPETVLQGMWDRLKEVESAEIFLIPYGGRMSQISESSTPFPHRAGNLYKILYYVNWSEDGIEASQKHIDWSRKIYTYMTPYVSKNPREAYLNYRDLDIGTNNQDGSRYEEAKSWGEKYFRNNFDRLVLVKTKVDPGNFFRNEQSIPPLAW
ncbi:hypothetical protein K2173_000399 [Erythroxylum novogranatense]|uniref:FAD-binding PCMH-type domain-containing protein n=1 Tax=Erythroxylum novogranatense TaxID=1862640 RepID=A0AAV8SX33_9ROSI|nr:hypothetical protein K2173_000399 [Erythroxylum novogranatense]